VSQAGYGFAAYTKIYSQAVICLSRKNLQVNVPPTEQFIWTIAQQSEYCAQLDVL